MRTSLARILAETHGYRLVIALGVFFSLLGTGMSLLYPLIIGKVMDLAIDGTSGRMATISWLCAMLAFVLFARAILSSLGGYFLESKGTVIVNRLKKRVFEKLIRSDYQYFFGQKVGDLVSRMQVDAETIRNAVTHAVSNILNQMFTFIGAVVLMLFMDWELTFLVLVLAPVSAIVSAYFGPRIAKYSRLTHDSSGNSGAVASEALTGIHTVKAFGLEEHVKRNFSETINSAIKNAIKAIRLNSIFGAALNFSVTLTAIGIFWYGGMKVIDGRMSGGVLIAFLLYSETLTQGFLVISAIYGQIAKAVGSSSRVFEILGADGSCQESINCKKFLDNRESVNVISVHDVGFTYATGKCALSKINFFMGKSEVVGLIGPSGCGKSTLANILSGIYRASCGYVAFNDESSEKESCENFRANVLLVPQDTFIFNDSIFNNIHMVAPAASEQDVMRAANLACVTEFSDRLPSGMDTLIGERGSRLSGGQRQRIGLARALLMRPRLLILDEATSALDAKIEMCVIEGIMEMTRDLSMAVIFITHRVSVLKCANSILEMDSGRIIWSGSSMDYLHKHKKSCSINQPDFDLASAA